ncbi:hypothetical protein OSB04_010156, partial [Centaurea solstitialis]
MDVQDQATHGTPSGHHGVHLCHRCGWPFPKAHPSAKHRRAHKKICGTIEGYTNLIGSEVVSDDEHHLDDDDKEKTPSPVIDKKKSFSRSEEDMFSDAVTEFSDSVEDRSVVFHESKKTLDRDLFYSFNDGENGGSNEVLNAPIEVSEVDPSLTISKNLDTHEEKNGENEKATVCKSSETKLESQPLEAESIVLVDEKVQESQTSEPDKHAVSLAVTNEAKDADAISEEIKNENLESDYEHVPEVVKESEVDLRVSGVDEEIKHEKFESDHKSPSEDVKEHETDEIKQEKLESEPSEVVKESETDEIKQEKFESLPSEVVKESETDESVSVVTEKADLGANEQIEEVVKDFSAVLTEKEDLEAPILEKCSIEHTQKEVDESASVLAEKEHLGAPILEKEDTHEVFEEPSVLAEKEDLVAPILEKEHNHEVFEEPISILAEKEDLGAPILEKEHNHEVFEESISVLAEKEDLGAPILEKEHNHEVFEEPISVFAEKRILEHQSWGKNMPMKLLQNPFRFWLKKRILGNKYWRKARKIAPTKFLKNPFRFWLKKRILGHQSWKARKNTPMKLLKNPIQGSWGPNLEKYEVVEESKSVLAEKEDVGAQIKEKSSKEDPHEVVEEPDLIFAEKEDLGATISEKSSKEHTHEVIQEPDSVLAEKEELGATILEKSSKEHTHEVVEEPISVLAEKEDLGAPNSENHEVIEEPKSDLGAQILEKSSKEPEKEDIEAPNSEKCEVVVEPDSGLTEKKDLGTPNSENFSQEHTKEVIKETKVDNGSNIASGVVSKHIIEETNTKPMPNQDPAADFSIDSGSRNSLEGNWGSVSVLSTASIDAEASHSIEKSKVNSGKLVAADEYDPPSFMTLVEPKTDDQKPAVDKLESKSEASQAGWFPTLTNVTNESEGRKRNEEVIAKVTNWSAAATTTATAAGKHSTPLKNLLGEAKSPTAKQPPQAATEKDEAAAVQKDEVAAAAVMSPPKLIDDGKNARKKVKGRGSWMPF